MRLTIVNLFMQGERIRERTRSAGILARKPGELNPPYAGRRAAVEPEYRVGGVTMARRGNGRPGDPSAPRLRRGWVPAFAGTTNTYTAILRCRTGAPVLTPSAASMMALASMPWWR